MRSSVVAVDGLLEFVVQPSPGVSKKRVTAKLMGNIYGVSAIRYVSSARTASETSLKSESEVLRLEEIYDVSLGGCWSSVRNVQEVSESEADWKQSTVYQYGDVVPPPGPPVKRARSAKASCCGLSCISRGTNFVH